MSLNHLTYTDIGQSDELEIACVSLKYMNSAVQCQNENLIIPGNQLGAVQPHRFFCGNITVANGGDGFFNWSWGTDPSTPVGNFVCFLSWSYPFINTGTYWVVINPVSNGLAWCVRKDNGSSCKIATNAINTDNWLKARDFSVLIYGY